MKKKSINTIVITSMILSNTLGNNVEIVKALEKNDSINNLDNILENNNNGSEESTKVISGNNESGEEPMNVAGGNNDGSEDSTEVTNSNNDSEEESKEVTNDNNYMDEKIIESMDSTDSTNENIVKPLIKYSDERETNTLLYEQNGEYCTCGEIHLEEQQNISLARSAVTPVINGIRVNKQLIDINYSKGVTISPKYIVIHDTDNRSKGANAMANRNYFANHPNAEASAHYLVDDSNIVQALEDNWRGWHVGDGKHPEINNSTTIGIELCVNSDNNFDKTVENGIALTKYLMNKYNIPPENVVRHYEASQKICPRMMIKDRPELWTYFKESIGGSVNGGNSQGDSNQDVGTADKPISQGKVVNVTSSLNVRQSASSTSTVVATLSPGQTVSIYGESNGFYKIHYIQGSVKKYGYASKGYISVDGESSNDSSNISKGVVTATSLNVRSGAGTSYPVIGSVYKNNTVSIIGESGSWYKISFNNTVGYVSKEYIGDSTVNSGGNTSTSNQKGTVTATSLNVRSGAGTSYSVIGSVYKNNTVSIIGESGSWYKINFNNTVGYVSKEFINTSGASTQPSPQPNTQKGVVTASSVNIRSGAGTNYSIIGTANKNTEVSITGESGNWYKISINNTVGYISKDYVSKSGSSVGGSSTSNSKAYVQVVGGLNVRTGPGTNYGIMASLYNNKEVTVIGESGDWYKIRFDGREGYVSKQYIKVQ